MTSANDVTLDPSVTRVVGIPNETVNMWGITRNVRGRWERLTYPDESGTHLKVWPLSELTIEAIRDRWGAGEYRVQWFVQNPDAVETRERFRARGTGPAFQLSEPEPVRVTMPPLAAQPVAAPPPPPVASALPSGLAQALEVMALIDQRSGAMLERTMSVAAAMAGRGGGLDAQTLGLLMGQQAQQTRDLIASLQQQHEQSLSTLRGELATLRTQLEDDDDDDGNESASIAVARAAAPMFKPGKPVGETLKTSLLNFAVEQPDKVIELLKAVPQVLSALGSYQAQQAQQAAAPPPPVARPKAMPAPPPPAPVNGVHRSEPPPPTGLNELLSRPAEGAAS